ncbi:carbohydrate ABC transporter permease [Paenibacillus sacheonensis]|uniref:ABC transporter permease subunit n=1 Tax=Paenibacillus sacheonensis TaxID=742054 RepID=A0A7X5BX46_9BACL|nr:carbohydrate ABC transporter permease [Paenibacillus sacheonensis]MBM7565152.1 putative aldouronate transport system permease protein [Paenibacillus sacheonensis]NBC70068.1 ABC transporter permease subunit [Paenibacillus sacheonensis]
MSKLHDTWGTRLFGVINYLLLAGAAFLCILPLINVLAVSLSSSHAANANLVGLWPVDFTIQSYKVILSRPEVLKAFWISTERTLLGVLLNNVLTILMAYPLAKSAKQFTGRHVYMWGMIFVMLFNGGLVPTYIIVHDLGLLNSMWALVLPGAVPIFSVILMMNFLKQLPSEIEEAAFMDGASYFTSLSRIIVPLSMPVIATVTLFHFVGHWNDWFSGLLYMTDISKYPLQTMLQSVVKGNDIMTLDAAKLYADVSDRTLKGAQVFVTALPILVLYPFLQKYFTKGIVLGSVKG